MIINNFFVGDLVEATGIPNVLKIISNIPCGGFSITDYLKTNKYECEWKEDGVPKTKVFDGSELTLISRMTEV